MHRFSRKPSDYRSTNKKVTREKKLHKLQTAAGYKIEAMFLLFVSKTPKRAVPNYDRMLVKLSNIGNLSFRVDLSVVSKHSGINSKCNLFYRSCFVIRSSSDCEPLRRKSQHHAQICYIPYRLTNSL